MCGVNLTDLPNFDMENAEVEVIEHPPAATERSAARRIALQVLYEIDCSHHMVGDVITARLNDEELTRRVEKYVRQIVEGVTANLDQLDAFIQRFASEFPLDQVAIIDRNILRLGVYELAAQQNTSMNVIIAEAMELANIYGAEGSLRFVNGVLGAIAAEVTADNSPQLIVTENGE
ncbi:MAG: transcription antitermination factor NusB [Anaerolineaceae bacterium]|nr:transcription antitermination factor NusB [Anaerolineaceae bacterium]